MKITSIIFAAMLVVGLSSCNKEKDCECTSSVAGLDDVVTQVTIEDGDCEDSNTNVGGVSFSCVEK